MGGSSKKQTIGYKYYLGMHLVLHHSVADNMSRITVDERTAWTGILPGGRSYINAEGLFGGEKREGGVSGYFDFLDGRPGQPRNAYLQARLGSNIPAFRGVASVVLNQVYVGLNPYLKNWSFRSQRIFKKSDGSAQWYEAKAGIAVINVPETMDFSHDQTIIHIAENDGWSGASFTNPADGARWDGGRTYHSSNVLRLGADGILQKIAVTGMEGYRLEGGMAAWGRIFFFSKDGGSSFRIAESDNNGATWKVYSQATIGSGAWQNTHGTLWDPFRQRILVCGGFDGSSFIVTGVMTLIDLGGGVFDNRLQFTHKPISGLTSPTYAIGFAMNSDGSVIITQNFVSNSANYMRSTDGGETWTTHPAPGAHTCGSANWVPALGAFGVFGLDGSTPVFRTSVDGLTWTIHSILPPIGSGGWLGHMVVDPIAGTIILGGGPKFNYSRDNGVNWQSGDVSTSLGVNAYKGIDYFWSQAHSAVMVLNIGSRLENGEYELRKGYPISGDATGDMNPAHIIRECLTDSMWGMGYSSDAIDDASFTAAADQLFTEQMGISILWDQQSTIEDFIDEIIRHIDATLFVSRTTGKFVLKLIRGGYDESGLLVLDESNIERIDNFSRPAFGELINTVTVNYWDSIMSKTATLTAHNDALIQLQGGVIGTTVNYPGFTNAGIAGRVALRDLNALSRQLASCTIYTNREASQLTIGDVFKLVWPDTHDGYIVMRVTAMAFGDGRTNKIKIDCIEDVFALPEQSLTIEPDPEWVNPSQPPSTADTRLVIESPYYEVVRELGEVDAAAQFNAVPEAGWVVATAKEPNSALNAIISIDSGIGYEEQGIMDFCPTAIVDADFEPDETVIAIREGISMDEIRIGSWAQIDEEIIRIDAFTDSSITVGRGCLDTAPAKHLLDAPIFFAQDFLGIAQTSFVASDVVNVKLLPVSGSGTVDLADASADVVTLDQRSNRPYAPGNVAINGLSYPTSAITGDMLITWAHRNRLQQTGGEIVDFLDGDIGPEPGTTYTLRVYDDSLNLLITEQLSISGNSFTVLKTLMPSNDRVDETGLIRHTEDSQVRSAEYMSLRLEIHAVRSGVTSWQTVVVPFNWNYGV